MVHMRGEEEEEDVEEEEEESRRDLEEELNGGAELINMTFSSVGPFHLSVCRIDCRSMSVLFTEGVKGMRFVMDCVGGCVRETLSSCDWCS